MRRPTSALPARAQLLSHLAGCGVHERIDQYGNYALMASARLCSTVSSLGLSALVLCQDPGMVSSMYLLALLMTVPDLFQSQVELEVVHVRFDL